MFSSTFGHSSFSLLAPAAWQRFSLRPPCGTAHGSVYVPMPFLNSRWLSFRFVVFSCLRVLFSWHLSAFWLVPSKILRCSRSGPRLALEGLASSRGRFLEGWLWKGSLWKGSLWKGSLHRGSIYKVALEGHALEGWLRSLWDSLRSLLTCERSRKREHNTSGSISNNPLCEPLSLSRRAF